MRSFHRASCLQSILLFHLLLSLVAPVSSIRGGVKHAHRNLRLLKDDDELSETTSKTMVQLEQQRKQKTESKNKISSTTKYPKTTEETEELSLDSEQKTKSPTSDSDSDSDSAATYKKGTSSPSSTNNKYSSYGSKSGSYTSSNKSSQGSASKYKSSSYNSESYTTGGSQKSHLIQKRKSTSSSRKQSMSMLSASYTSQLASSKSLSSLSSKSSSSSLSSKSSSSSSSSYKSIKKEKRSDSRSQHKMSRFSSADVTSPPYFASFDEAVPSTTPTLAPTSVGTPAPSVPPEVVTPAPTEAPTPSTPAPTTAESTTIAPTGETPAPTVLTASPTASPTQATPVPTAKPTASPTQATLVPTARPTAPPTPATPMPTARPTAPPTLATPLPTARPMPPPTLPQTPRPTSPPTPLPTLSPTPLPTPLPTQPPTNPPIPPPTNPPTNPPTLPISSYKIDLSFAPNVSPTLQANVQAAARRIESVIIGDLPTVNNVQIPENYQCTDRPTSIDDMWICVQVGPLPDFIEGQGGFNQVRFDPDYIYLPAVGYITISDQVPDPSEATLIHEMMHSVGFGTVWAAAGLTPSDGAPCMYASATSATAEYQSLSGCTGGSIPMSDECQHWDETCFGDELMTPLLSTNPDGSTPYILSRMTIASFADLGYTVNLDAADVYTRADMDPSCLCGTGRVSDVDYFSTLVDTPPPPRLSDNLRQKAIDYGKKVLEENNKEIQKQQYERLSSSGQIVEVLFLIVRENGVRYSLIVTPDS